MKRIATILFLFISSYLNAQELFPLNEPASNVPKGTLGVRVFGESYKEVSLYRNMFALRLMYGISSRLSVYATASVSNHHSPILPPDLATHTHTGNQTIYFTTSIKRGVPYPYLYNGDDVYVKYRFLSSDGQNS